MRWVAATLALMGLLAARPAMAEPLVLQGSTTLCRALMVPQQRAIEELSGQKLTIVPNKSSLGLRALFEGNAQFGMISGPLDKEIEALRKVVPDAPFDQLRAFEILRTRMAFAVHPDNPIRTVSAADMRRILLGQVLNWAELGGRNIPIRLVMVRQGGGVQASVENQLLDGQPITVPDPIRVQISTQVVKIVLQEPGALGLAQLGVIRRAHAPEMKLAVPVVQKLSLVSLGQPTAAMMSVIKAARELAAKAVE
jgi:ABC-type phosphate transport system substrate-binding protein